MFILHIIRFLTGYLVLSVSGAFSERFINLAAREGMRLWGIHRIPQGLQLRMRIGDFRRIRSLARRTGCRVHIQKKRGLPFFLYRYRRRYALLTGVFLFLAILFVMSSFLWSIEVKGAETVNPEVIVARLADLGFKPGVLLAKADTKLLCEQLTIDIPELAWASINIMGSKAVVEVKERVPIPEMVDIKTPSNVTAAKRGLIVSMEVAEGDALVSPGTAVSEGDLCVTGVLQSQALGVRYVPARARIYAKTWTKVQSSCPTTVDENVYTGEEQVRYTLSFFGHDLKIYLDGGISYGEYDKITSINELHLGENIYLPVALIKERYLESKKVPRTLEYEEQLSICRKRRDELAAAVLDKAKIETYTEEVTQTNGELVLLTEYTCLEDIAQRVPIQ